MPSRQDSPPYILILGGLFLIAYAAFKVGSHWMTPPPPDYTAPIVEFKTLTPTPKDVELQPTPYPFPEDQGTPVQLLPTATATLAALDGDGNPYPPPPEPYPDPEQSLTPTQILDPTFTPTTPSEPYPDPEQSPTPTQTLDPTFTPTTPSEPYPDPEQSPTPAQTLDATITPTTPADQFTHTPTTLASSPTHTLTPTQAVTVTVPTPTATLPPITTLAYSETIIIANGTVHQAIWSPAGSTIAVATSSGVFIHDTASMEKEYSLERGADIASIAYNPKGGLLVTGGRDATIHWWDPRTGAFQGSTRGHLLGVTKLSFSQLGSTLASASDDVTVRLWDSSAVNDRGPDSVESYQTLRDSVTQITDMQINSDGSLVAASSYAHVHIWNPADGSLVKFLNQPQGWYAALAFSADSTLLATAFEGRLEFWDTLSWERTRFIPLDSPVTALTFNPAGTLIVAGFEDGSLMIWDAHSGVLLADLTGHARSVTSLAFNPTGGILLSASQDGTIRQWEILSLLNR